MISSLDKPALRIQARHRRAEAFAARPDAGLKLAAFAETLAVPPGGVAAGYWPMAEEIDPRPLMEALVARGCLLCLPVVEAKAAPLGFRAWRPGDALEAGPHGTVHPLSDASSLMPHMLLVPLLAFDGRLHRLGYGGGYYDRTLESLRAAGPIRAVGLAFAAQRLDSLPAEADDQRLDAVLTECGLILAEG
jgi:5-formyltetrahydrofolate cyclo-ligase